MAREFVKFGEGGGARGAAREQAFLERRGEAWSLELRPSVLNVRHSRGMEYLARLLEEPGAEIDAAELHGGPADGNVALDVRRAIRSAIRRIARSDPALGLHLERAIRTGATCSYLGSAERPIEWTVEGFED